VRERLGGEDVESTRVRIIEYCLKKRNGGHGGDGAGCVYVDNEYVCIDS